MIKTVTVEEFDRDILKVGQFITFCNVIRVDDGSGNGLGKKINGIITYIYPTEMMVYTSKNEKIRITLDDIKSGEKRILGILDDAIIDLPENPIEVVPENPPVVNP